MSESENRLSELISDEVSSWKSKAEYRKENKSWLDKSAKIALKILNHIKESGISQKQFAEMINVSPQQVSKIMKGSENLTLETISKIEDALGIKLIDLDVISLTNTYELNSRQDLVNNYNYLQLVTNSIIINSNSNTQYSLGA